jgi:ABC-type sugar transport system ATPase subunit
MSAVEESRQQAIASARPLVELDGVAKYFDVSAPWLNRVLERQGRKVLHAVDGVTLSISRGETLALVGESGCGKSTIARLIVGLYMPTRGSIRFDGQDTRTIRTSAGRLLHRRMQMIFQDPYASLNPRWKVLDIVGEPLREHGLVEGKAAFQRRVGELLQAKLKAAGFDVTLREVQLPDTYGYIKHLKSAPDLLLQTNTPDAAHPDTWARIVFYSTGGLNFFGFSDKHVDKALDDALDAPPADATKLYQQAGQDVIDSNSIFFLGNVKDVFVLQKNLAGVESVPEYPWTITYAPLKRGGS